MRFIFIIFLFLTLTQIANGHSLGQSLEKKVDSYIVDVGYDAIDKIYAGDFTRFDFNLWSNDNKTEIADFNHVWVRIAPKEKGVVFAGFLYRPEFLLTGMSYTFQKPGEYELTVRFLDKNDKTLAEASFPLTIEGLKLRLSFKMIGIILLEVIIFIGIVSFIIHKTTYISRYFKKIVKI